MHELMIPFIRTAAARVVGSLGHTDAPAVDTHATMTPTRSQWLFFKIYTGLVTADAILRDELPETLLRANAKGLLDRWFFVRYGDPRHHLRLRFRAAMETENLHALLMEFVYELSAKGLACDYATTTYRREVWRYGGTRGIAVAERIFQADSELVVSVLRGGGGAEQRLAERQLLSIWAIETVFRALDVPFTERLAACRRAVASERKETLRAWSTEFSKRRQGIAEWLTAASGDVLPATHEWFPAMRKWRDAVGTLGTELLELRARGELMRPLAEIADSLIHMHMNRSMRLDQNWFERQARFWTMRRYREMLARGQVQ
jgi:thiopeptide-type bacteriocin biosynthesis protein